MLNFWQTVIVGLLSGGISATIVGAFLNHHLNKKLDKESQQRIQAAKIAEFFAKWAKYAGKETQFLNKKDLYDYYEEITRMSYELSLWIEDEKLLKKIMQRLTNLGGSLPTKQLLIEVRELILDKKSEILTADDLVHWYVKDNENDPDPRASN